MSRILIVDDHEGIREVLKALLELRGHEIVGSAANGREAFDLLQHGCSPDVLIVDLEMPVMNGWALIEALDGADGRMPPVVVLSSRVSDAPRSSRVVAAVSKGCFDADALAHAIDTAASSVSAGGA